MQAWPVQDAKARFSEFLEACLADLECSAELQLGDARSRLSLRCAGRADSAYIRSAWGLALSVRVSDPVRFRRRVALGGPLPVAGLGLVMATGAAIASSSVLAGASAALLVHGLGTLPGSSDGNRIWNRDHAADISVVRTSVRSR